MSAYMTLISQTVGHDVVVCVILRTNVMHDAVTIAKTTAGDLEIGSTEAIAKRHVT
jgi:hypothetical protein